MNSPVSGVERGGAPATEAAILTVIVGLLLAFTTAAGRVAAAESAADQAARGAARIASVQRDPTAGQVAAEAETRRVLDGQGIACDQLDVRVEPDPPSAPFGTQAVVRARVTCAVRWSDVGIPGLPGSHDINADFVSPIDRYRERT
ncbi:hypothetical protein [Pseudonocardia sp. DLS-67]